MIILYKSGDMTKYCNACEMWELFIRKALGFFMIIVGAGGILEHLPHFISRHAQPFIDAGVPERLVEFGLGAVPIIDLLIGIGLLVDQIRCAPTRILGFLSFTLFLSHFFFSTGNFYYPLGLCLLVLTLVILQSQSKYVCRW